MENVIEDLPTIIKLEKTHFEKISPHKVMVLFLYNFKVLSRYPQKNSFFRPIKQTLYPVARRPQPNAPQTEASKHTGSCYGCFTDLELMTQFKTLMTIFIKIHFISYQNFHAVFLKTIFCKPVDTIAGKLLNRFLPSFGNLLSIQLSPA